jgi:hypothetical protein
MTSFFSRHRKKIAMFMLINLTFNLVYPLKALAITSGPAQPETQGFQAIGASDMVDLFSGDFKYNIPLMDVGGYPLNLAYSAGSGVDDEASWVGTGWTLNPGTINRQMKALPDDFAGDKVRKQVNMKPKIKYGIAGEFKPDVFAFEFGSAKLKASLYKDNYYGWSASIGVNASLELLNSAAGNMTTDLGINSSSRDGAGLSTAINYSYAWGKNDKQNKIGMNLGFDYNSRQGMQQLSLGATYANDKFKKLFENQLGVSYVDNGVATYTPTVDVPKTNDAFTLSFHAGPEIFGIKGAVGFDGSYSAERIPERLMDRYMPAFGYLYAHETTNDRKPDILVDMNREKDVPYFKGTPVIPVPVLTNDNFVMTSQNGSGQFKILRSGSGIGHDPYMRTGGGSTSLGLDLMAGNMIEWGGHVYRNDAFNVTNKWVGGGSVYQTVGDYKSPNANPYIQHAIFKKTGEMVQSDEALNNMLGKEKAVAINLTSGSEFSSPSATRILYDNNQKTYPLTGNIQPAKRQKRVDNFTYLTASEAARYGLEKYIYDYKPVEAMTSHNCMQLTDRKLIARTSGGRQPHHISEITVLDNQGKRMVYGIPVYNTYQEEVSFSVNHPTDPTDYIAAKQRGLISYDPATDATTNNKKGRDNYFSKDIMPPYATSFLLTAIVSPDYRDLKNDGVTDDDFGNAVKFNYSKLPGQYQWRSPYGQAGNQASYNEGLIGDNGDDKASYTYGEKEIWYMHSIESKNFVAVFYTSNRLDGLGVLGANGLQNSTYKLKKLDKVALYSKPEFKHSGTNAVPIKVAHFIYEQTMGSGYPNVASGGGTGRLKLTKVYFTYGQNQKGSTTPYVFTYKSSYTVGSTTITAPAYDVLQTDKWGNLKPSIYNPAVSGSIANLTNNEFPYALQEAAVANELAGVFNLEKIELPSGGEIRINYEADDYAYVQNKRACNMFMLAGVSDGIGEMTDGNFINSNYVYVKSTKLYSDNGKDLVKGLTYLYGKFYVTLRPDVDDYVPGYAELDPVNTVTYMGHPSPDLYIYRIAIKKIDVEGLPSGTQKNPFAVASWQFLRNNLPHHAYPGYDNGTAGVDNVGANIVGAIKALASSLSIFKELFENYNHKYNRKLMANHIDLSRSWVRLTDPTGKKIGGGHRVKKVTIKDNWRSMLGDTNPSGGYADNEYGQIYDYSTKDEYGKTISSGVASYEPGIGSDENPFKTPIPYSRKVKMGLDYNTYVEEPIGESYMPSASVGYSKVTVKSFGASSSSTVNSEDKLGYTENEFYTAKEFPTLIEKIGPSPVSYDPELILTLVVSISRSNMVTTQGLSVIQNDMHGKPKAVKTYDRNKNLISSVEYHYKVKDAAAEKQELNNEVDLLQNNGKVTKGTIGQDMEFYSDMRHQNTTNTGIRAGIYAGNTYIIIATLPFAMGNFGGNFSSATFNSASTIKVITKCGIVQSVTKMENGSSATTENMLWDPETGEVLLTRTNNEFDQPVYNLTYPAHWINQGMAPAYQNLESVLPSVSTSSIGELTGGTNPGSITDLLQEGDELIDLNGNATYWVINGDPAFGLADHKFLIDKIGKKVTSLAAKKLKIHYSGHRNIASTGLATIVSLNNPISNGEIKVSQATRILDAKAVVYSDVWGMPIANTFSLDEEASNSCPCCACFKNFFFSAVGAKVGTAGKPGIFALPNEHQNAGVFMEKASPTYVSTPADNYLECYTKFLGGYTSGTSEPNFLNAYESEYFKPTLSSGNVHLNPVTGKYDYALVNGDIAYLGGRKITYSRVTTQFNNLMNNAGGSPAILSELFSGKYRFKKVDTTGGCMYELYYKEIIALPRSSSATEASSMGTPCVCAAEVIGGEEKILQVFIENGKMYKTSCEDPTNTVINPYFYGIKGTWKPMKSYVYQTSRNNVAPIATPSAAANITKAGYYQNYSNFIDFNSSTQRAYLKAFTDPNDPNSLESDSRWVWSQKSRYYSVKGEELESVDALQRYTAALYGYKQTLPIAVGKNTRYVEMKYTGFEDYYTYASGMAPDAGTGTCAEPCLLPTNLSFRTEANAESAVTSAITTAKSHTGKFSLKLPDASTAQSLSVDAKLSDYSTIDNNVLGRLSNEYLLNNNYLAKGLTLQNSKKYIVSFWVKDNTPTAAAPQVSLKVATAAGTVTKDVSTQKWPVVEGWKRIEMEFTAHATDPSLQVKIKSLSTNVYIDDIRVFPADGQIKTYAYDPISQRLMAELDENNFATFYEYDDEGTLQRVKKETQRGIMTIKESRQHIRKSSL